MQSLISQVGLLEYAARRVCCQCILDQVVGSGRVSILHAQLDVRLICSIDVLLLPQDLSYNSLLYCRAVSQGIRRLH